MTPNRELVMAKQTTQANGQVRDITTMTDSEIAAYMQERKAQQAKLVAEKGKEARKDVENYCQQKWGLTLAQVWMAGDNYKGPQTYKNPKTGELYTYSGRGKVPEWLWISSEDHKPNAAYEHKSS